MMKNISVLGSTGSIGVNSLNVIDSNPGDYRVLGLAAGGNIDLLAEQIIKFRPIAAAVSEERSAEILRSRLGTDLETRILAGVEGLVQIAALDKADTVISAMSGAAGLIPTYAAVKAGKDIALANKETMVMAGPIIMSHIRRLKTSILPIDSEHSAILQSLQGHPREDLRRIVLTASGGPFRDLPIEEMGSLTPDQALRHPNWNMGKKISIDSATMMNKGLEVIEARWLFGLEMDQIDIVIHPESIVHSMVEYMDGSVIAQMGIPDMITPISYALSYPRHRETRLPPLRLEEVGRLTFQEPDLERFRCLRLALGASRTGDSMPIVMNGANEIAVDSFLKGRIGFLQIPDLIERTMDVHRPVPVETIEGVMEVDSWARDTARRELELLH